MRRIVVVLVAVLALVGCSDEGGGSTEEVGVEAPAEASGLPDCETMLAEGAPAPEGYRCVEDGETRSVMAFGWDCDDGRKLEAVEDRWWFSDGTVQVMPDGESAPPPGPFTECKP